MAMTSGDSPETQVAQFAAGAAAGMASQPGAEPQSSAKSRSAAEWLDEFGPLVPLAAVAASLPYVLVYFRNLWELPHYQFFPLVLVAVAWLARARWGGRLVGGVLLRSVRVGLLATGIGGSLCATLFASPWMGFFGFVFSLAGWLAYHRDRESGGSLLYLALPVLLIWQPPLNSIVTADTALIQGLQTVSARLSSQALDLLGYAHHQPGTVLELAGCSFGVAEACSGVNSFFVVLCSGALLAIYLRRAPLHSALLLATSPLWAILMNTVRITAIPIAQVLADLDLSHGTLHDALGLVTVGVALLLMVSTDELLLKIRELLPLPVGLSGDALFSARLSSTRTLPQVRQPAVGARAGSGADSGPAALRPAGLTGLALAAPLLLLFAGCFAIQSYDVLESWGQQRHVVDFFRDEPLLDLVESDGLENLGDWPKRTYLLQNRELHNDDLGQRSNLWYYTAPFGNVTVAFDQMFPGWHELTRCYRNAGWKIGQRQVLTGSAVQDWPVVTVEMTRGNEHGFLAFSLVGRSGKVLQPPGAFNYWTVLRERLQGRLTPAVRGALFDVVSYQMQAFASGYAPVSEADRAATVERFLVARAKLWGAAQQQIATGR
jgi:exosortase